MNQTKSSLPRYAVPGIIAAVVLISAVIAIAIYRLHPLPPRIITLATGPEGSAYSEFGQRYRDILSKDGIELRLVPTAGDIDNITRLRDPGSGVSISFVGNGFLHATEAPDLVSLGTLAYQPLWVFMRGDRSDRSLKDLPGKRISIGPEGSGTRAFALQLLALNAVNIKDFQAFPYSPQEAADRLQRGELDLIVLLTSWDSPVVKRLMASDGVTLVNFPRADAYVALYPNLDKLIVPMGVGSLAKNKPPQDVAMLATKVNLVVRKDLHPAIAYLLLEAAEKVHSGPGLFQKPGQFPAGEAIDLPLSDQARNFYKSGRPFLQRYLPFWMAAFAQQALIVLLPVAGLAYPLGKLLALSYASWMRFRIIRVYGRLRRVESALDERPASDPKDDLLIDLDEAQKTATHLRVAAPYSPMLYTLQHHIALVRERITRGS